MPINISLMGTAPDNSASTAKAPKGAFAHPTRLIDPINAPIPPGNGKIGRLGPPVARRSPRRVALSGWRSRRTFHTDKENRKQHPRHW
uniref:Uncharacterized protein n=1 Tax=Candidatus Kentrum sp. DK TaxID=2126562 RepID=A0A450RX85_9GAMM|nr:MAG: hypothetical protein BECKDK2373B_GA0170837_100612 [Candidatus Kentron sp. DK]